jgi:hypothetical protein
MRLAALSVAAAVDRNHPVALRELVEYPGVHPLLLEIAGKTMREHDGIARACLTVPDAHAFESKDLFSAERADPTLAHPVSAAPIPAVVAMAKVRR